MVISMELEKKKLVSMKGSEYLGEISALCFLNLPDSDYPLLLAGSGSHLLLFDINLARLLKSFPVFHGVRVHGIASSSSSSSSFFIAVSGERRLKLFTLHLPKLHSPNLIFLHLLPTFSHWVLHFSFLKDEDEDASAAQGCSPRYLAVGCSDNTLHVWDILNSIFLLQNLKCPERCLLYSMKIRGHKFEHLIIASGTIFNELCYPHSLLVILRYPVFKVCAHGNLRKSHVVRKIKPQGQLVHKLINLGSAGKISNLKGNMGNEPIIYDGFVIYSFENSLQIIVWKLAHIQYLQSLSSFENEPNSMQGFDDVHEIDGQYYEAKVISRLSGHQGSIFCLSWSSDGSTLVSVSDDRSARMWTLDGETSLTDDMRKSCGTYSAGPMLFGHSARVWDCCISDSIIITAGEDCSCRIWGLDGKELRMIKEHIGRGIWRCLYDVNSSLLATAGFDSAIKVHCLPDSSSILVNSFKEINERKAETLQVRIPNSPGHTGLMDSKSEYVRCLKFAGKYTIYVATNHGYVYHAKLNENGSVEWTILIRVTEEVPVICLDLLSKDLSKLSHGMEHWLAVGDGRGAMKVLAVRFCDNTPKVAEEISWLAEKERQLLGVYWCTSLGCRFIFTSNPRGSLKLWRLSAPLSYDGVKTFRVHLVADFLSPFGTRIISLDASCEEEVLVCGDLRGNLVLFPLSKSILLETPHLAAENTSSITYFKGAHGISSVSSISITRFSSIVTEICSTGGDGCICYLEYIKDRRILEFVGMKQVRELSLVQSVSADSYTVDDSAIMSYAVGFSSTDFLIWNLASETKVLQVKCGGWRRPYSFYLGQRPDIDSSFAYVKDDIIYVHRYWVKDIGKNIFPRTMHLQFHGREIHSLCIIPEVFKSASSGPKLSWIATGCEDGTVRLTRYDHDTENWAVSNLLGEHVGGSAVRSLCFVSKMHSAKAQLVDAVNGNYDPNNSLENDESPSLLISVGAKRVLTSWLLKIRQISEADASDHGVVNNKGSCNSLLKDVSSMSFKWLSTDMPVKSVHCQKKAQNVDIPFDAVCDPKYVPTAAEMELIQHENSHDNDWRYLAVTVFLVAVAQSRLTVCFVVVSCSDATLMLRALVLPYRYWFDIASLTPLSSPVLALQHALNPVRIPNQGTVITKNMYMAVSGSTDGSITFWDLTDSVEAFLLRVSSLHEDKSMDIQKRPRTGRGSQGGRWWKSVDRSMTEKKSSGGSMTLKNGIVSRDSGVDDHQMYSYDSGTASCGARGSADESSPRPSDIKPLHVLHNVHQSGVNCLHLYCHYLGDTLQCSIISGGDDQALSFLQVELASSPTGSNVDGIGNIDTTSEATNTENALAYNLNERRSIQFLYKKKVFSGHSSAVKGVWTDGVWSFSVGLDQRIRCWKLQEDGDFVEYSHFLTSVPEPEALDVKASGRNCFQVVVAGRGMQIIEVLVSHGMEGE